MPSIASLVRPMAAKRFRNIVEHRLAPLGGQAGPSTSCGSETLPSRKGIPSGRDIRVAAVSVSKDCAARDPPASAARGMQSKALTQSAASCSSSTDGSSRHHRDKAADRIDDRRDHRNRPRRFGERVAGSEKLGLGLAVRQRHRRLQRGVKAVFSRDPASARANPAPSARCHAGRAGPRRSRRHSRADAHRSDRVSLPGAAA